ncbi:hypothetical protein [Cellulomonas hominis]|uniref:hypothetical protein n=1 Tax=Cellulomonas hominis TaxID=156981 RepID=UPI0014444E53|nr:hypothetical protein [Cellulomonas hominis]NKY08928.1 hypothetical protein [Cellulomonas hominis]
MHPHPFHEWTETTKADGGPRTYACTECAATAIQCATCDRTLDTTGRVCEHCVSRARNDLREVRDLYRRLPDVIAAAAGLHAVRYDRGGSGKTRSSDTTILGGAAFVLAGPGNSADRGVQLGRGETTEAIAYLAAAEQHDPPSVLGVLTGWEDAWRVEQGQGAADRTSVDAAVDYLVSAITWAAQHSGRWPEFRADIRALLGRLRHLTGESKAPVRSDVPCTYCAGTVMQRWTESGLDDVHECTRCGTRWDTAAHFALAIRHAHQDLANTHQDAEVTLDDARRILRDRVKRNTLNVWLKRDRERAEAGEPRQIPEHGRDVRGEPLYRLGDICARLRGDMPTSTPIQLRSSHVPVQRAALLRRATGA